PSGSRAQACLQPAHFCKLLDPTKGIDVTRHLDADRGLPAESLSKLDGIRSGNHDFSDVTAFVDGHRHYSSKELSAGFATADCPGCYRTGEWGGQSRLHYDQ